MTDEEPVHCVADLTMADYRAVTQFNIRRVQPMLFFLNAVVWGGGMGATIWLAAMAGAWGAMVTALIAWSGMIVAVRFVLEIPGAWTKGPVRVAASDHGVTIANDATQSTSSWAAFPLYGESKDRFFLMTGPGHGHVLPKAGFAAPAEIDRFRALAERHCERR